MPSSLDISALSRQQLIALHEQVVERIRFIDSESAKQSIQAYRLGDVVFFAPQGGKELKGTIVKKNQKTVGVLDESGVRWNVSPALLHRRTQENVFDADFDEIK